MKYAYMNHRIRMKKPDGPVIVVQEETETVEANRFEIIVGGQIVGHVLYDPKGLDACETHEVKAWLEFSEAVTLRPIGKLTITPHEAKPVAAEKKPNEKVKT